MSTLPYGVEKLPSGNDLWAISWIGKLNRPPDLQTQLAIEVFLTRLRNNNSEFGYHVPEYAYRNGEADRIMLPLAIGLLPCLRIGSIFKNSEQIPLNDALYDSITVDAFIQADQKYIGRGNTRADPENMASQPLLNTNLYPIDNTGNIFKDGYIYEIPCTLSGDRFGAQVIVVIPTWEIFRFYYAPSSKVANIMLSGQFADDAKGMDLLCNVSASIPPTNGTAFIKLRKDIPDCAAGLVGRLWVDKYARRQASLISKASTDPLPPMVRPPFYGETQWKLHGRNAVRDGKSFFFVYWIEKCSASFPIKKLLYGRDNPGGDSMGKPYVEFKDEIRVPVARASKNAKIVPDKDPSTKWMAEKAELQPDPNKFSFLANNSIEKIDFPDSGDNVPRSIQLLIAEIDRLATGEGVNTEEKIARLDLEERVPEERHEAPKQRSDDELKVMEITRAKFVKCLKILEKIGCFPPPRETQSVFSYDLLKSDVNANYDSFLEDADVAEIRHQEDGRHTYRIYLIETILDQKNKVKKAKATLCIWKKELREIASNPLKEEDSFAYFYKCYLEDARKWKSKIGKNYGCCRFIHRKSFPKGMPNRINKKFLELIDKQAHSLTKVIEKSSSFYVG